jgi:hypothetical protein
MIRIPDISPIMLPTASKLPRNAKNPIGASTSGTCPSKNGIAITSKKIAPTKINIPPINDNTKAAVGFSAIMKYIL